MRSHGWKLSALAAVAAVATTAALSGCQTENPVAIPGDQPAPFQESAMGTNAQVGSMLLRSVHIEAPPGPKYRPGDDATVWFTLVNEGRQPDTLTSLTSPAAKSVEIYWDESCTGTPRKVSALPLQSRFPGLSEASHAAPPFDSYFGKLISFRQEVLAGTTVPVTFAFARAGRVTVPALVQPSTAPRPAPTALCYQPSASRVPPQGSVPPA